MELPFAFTTTVLGQQAAGGETTTATLNYQKVEVGAGRLEFPFSIPSGYKKETRVGKK